MASSNEAAWTDQKGAKIRVGPSENHTPGPGEILIRIHAVAINPIDNAMINTGILINSWPIITGVDGAGKIEMVGPGVTRFSKGERVMACFAGSPEYRANRAFQYFAVAREVGTCPIPDSVSFEEAVVLPLAVTTAAAGLYFKSHLTLPAPKLNPHKTGETLVVWGASSAVGMAATQLAVASGLDVIAIAGSKHFDLCKSLGAKAVLDYKDSSVFQNLASMLTGKKVVGAFNASGNEDTVEEMAKVLKPTGAKMIASTQPLKREVALPEGLSLKPFRSGELLTTEEHKEQAKAVWQDFMPAAVESGTFKFVPEPQIVGKGLKAIQKALQIQAQGVSGKKVVVLI